MKTENIKVEGHKGTWYVIDKRPHWLYGKIYLLEHEVYGDEAASVIIDGKGNLVMENVYNGFDDLLDQEEF